MAPVSSLPASCWWRTVSRAWVWRVDLAADGSKPSFQVWLEHESMSYFPGVMKPEQPGVNGVGYAVKQLPSTTGHGQEAFMRVRVDPEHPQAHRRSRTGSRRKDER